MTQILVRGHTWQLKAAKSLPFRRFIRCLSLNWILVVLLVFIFVIPPSFAINIPVPEGRNYLPFQVEGIRSLVRSDYLLLADEMGLGKTISVIGALNVLGSSQKVLIIAPKSVIPNWEHELHTWLVDSSWSIGVATAKYGLPPTDVDILLLNYEIAEKLRDDIDIMGPYDIVVCDEAHYLKNADAIRTKAILGNLGLTHRGRGGIPTQRLWFLTGSPILNSPVEMFPLLRSLDSSFEVIPELQDISTFRDRYCGRQEGFWGVTYKGGRNLPELRCRLGLMRDDGTSIMVRRTKKEVLKDLPDKRHQLLPLCDDGKAAAGEARMLREALKGFDETINMPTQQIASAKPLQNRTVVELKVMLKDNGLKTTGLKKELIVRLVEAGATLEPEKNSTLESSAPAANLHKSAQSALRSGLSGKRSTTLTNILAAIGYSRPPESFNNPDTDKSILGALLTARHQTALSKVPFAIELIENAISSHKMVVFAYHRDVQEALFHAFEDRAVAISGGCSLEERADAVERFQNDPSVRLFVGSIRAAGTGITLSAASHVLFVEVDWSPLIVQQAEDRCHRIGQKSSVLVQYLFFKNTIDEHLSQLLATKQSTVAAALDEPVGAASWIFDFGKHEGLSVGDVAGSDPSYLDWLVEGDAYEKRPVLETALTELGYLGRGRDEDEKESYVVVDQSVQSQKVAQKGGRAGDSEVKKKRGGGVGDPGVFVLDFGKHKGKALRDIPHGYLHWLLFSGATKRNYQLHKAVSAFVSQISKED